jgi:hypothetical protein
MDKSLKTRIVAALLLIFWPGCLLRSQQILPGILNVQPAAGGGSGPVFAASEHCAAVANSCTITAAGGETFFIFANDFTASNTATLSGGGTATVCSGYPVAWDGSNNTAYMFKVTGVSPGSYAPTVNWTNTPSFDEIMVLAATSVTTSNCASSLSNSPGAGTTITGISFTNTANALVFCFADPEGSSTLSSSGSTFTMTMVDQVTGTQPADGQGTISSAGTNNCGWTQTSNLPWVQTTVVMQ